jgi:hypothetical protein
MLHILASIIYFDSDMSKSTNTVVYFDWKTVIFIDLLPGLRKQKVRIFLILTSPPSFALLTNERVIHSVFILISTGAGECD